MAKKLFVRHDRDVVQMHLQKDGYYVHKTFTRLGPNEEKKEAEHEQERQDREESVHPLIQAD